MINKTLSKTFIYSKFFRWAIPQPWQSSPLCVVYTGGGWPPGTRHRDEPWSGTHGSYDLVYRQSVEEFLMCQRSYKTLVHWRVRGNGRSVPQHHCPHSHWTKTERERDNISDVYSKPTKSCRKGDQSYKTKTIVKYFPWNGE